MNRASPTGEYWALMPWTWGLAQSTLESWERNDHKQNPAKFFSDEAQATVSSKTMWSALGCRRWGPGKCPHPYLSSEPVAALWLGHLFPEQWLPPRGQRLQAFSCAGKADWREGTIWEWSGGSFRSRGAVCSPPECLSLRGCCRTHEGSSRQTVYKRGLL